MLKPLNQEQSRVRAAGLDSRGSRSAPPRRLDKRKKIPVAAPCLAGNEKKYVLDCLNSTWISSSGRYVERFEIEFAKYCGARYATSCCNGTAALHLALLACGIKAGDEVIVPDMTYIASANAVGYCGARPVLIDCVKDTWNIDPSAIERSITSLTRAIIVVHLYGHSCDMGAILALAAANNLFVIEDAAEAIGTQYERRQVGALGDIGIFSFFGNKTITSGEGGAIVTNNKQLWKKARILKNQGMSPSRRYWFPTVGYNYRMTNIQAAIAVAQLERVDWHLAKRRRVANWYYEHLEELSGRIVLPIERPNTRHGFWMFSIRLKSSYRGITRDKLIKLLALDGIETRPVFHPLHSMPPYRSPGSKLLVSSLVGRTGLSLPTHGKMNQEDVRYITACLKRHLGIAAN